MASAFSQNQFLGSRISLISKSEIRYEGILYALDLSEATISLAKVRSFGTEDRPTERPVPPRDDVYEYIIFRGADIKVIDVVEPPKHAAANVAMAAMVPADPAIVDFSHSGAHGHIVYGNHSEGGGRMRPNNRRPGPPMYNNGGGSPQRRSGQYQPEQGPSNGRQNRHMMGGGGTPGRQNFGQQGGRNNYGGNFRQGGFILRENGGQFQPQRGRMTTPNRGGNFGQPQRRGGRQPGGGGNRSPFRPRGMSAGVFPPKMSFDGDYDFEKANEELLSQLSKAKLDDENAEASTSDDAQKEKDEQENKETRIFYKKDNFFDSISCEALERSKGNVPRVDWKAERKLNAETFGLTLNPNDNGGNRNPRRSDRRGGFRMPNVHIHYGSGGSNWMSPNYYYRGGNQRRQRIN